MRDYLRRFLIAGIMGLFITLLFLGGKNTQAEVKQESIIKIDMSWPSDGIITDVYGSRNGEHKGIDIAADLNTLIYPVANGVVSKSYYSNTYGNVIFVLHPSGYESVYAHLQERLVNEQDRVEKHTPVGKMGSTGNSTGVHLHFELHKKEWTFKKENAIDPMTLFGDISLGERVFAGMDHAIAVMGKSYTKETKNTYEKIKIYQVKKNDTLWSIAQNMGTSVEELKRINNINGTTIFPNQQLKLK